MSTRFNRNHEQVANDKFYTEDYRVDLNGVEQSHQKSIQDFETLPCIISGGNVTAPTWPDITASISACRARDKDGRPVQFGETEQITLVNTAGGNNYIILKYKASTDTPRNAFTTGVEYPTRLFDDFELEVAETFDPGDIILANIKKVSNVWIKYDSERTHPVYRPLAGDTTPPTDPADLVLTTGMMADTSLPLAAADFIPRTNPLAWLKAAWTASQDQSGIRGYEIFLIPLTLVQQNWVEQLDKRQEQKVVYSASDVRTDITFQNLTPGVYYRVKVRAVDNAGNVSGFASQDEIAGGAKQIPNACADAIENILVLATDMGVHISWDIKSDYVSKVIGAEVCYTDDLSDPDFDNKAHKKIFTDRNSVILPSRYTTALQAITVKAKIRLIDKTSRHCTIPFSIPPQKTKEYPGDIKTKFNEFAEAKSLINAFSRGQLSWENVRVVAKSGGQFTSIQSAVNSIATTEFVLVMLMPGLYEEDVKIDNLKSVGFLGIGDIRILGRIYCDGNNPGYVHFADNIAITNTQNGVIPFDVIIQSYSAPAYFNRLRIKQTNTTAGDACKITNATSIDVVKLIIHNCHFKSAKGYGLVLSTDELYAELRNNIIDAYKNLHIDCDATPSTIKLRLLENIFNIGAGATYCITSETATPKPNIYMATCKYNKAPDTSGLTCDFGAVDNITNVIFATDDLQAII